MHLQLDTIMIFVADIDLEKHFYNAILGFPILEEIPGEWILLSCGTVKIGLHKQNGHFASSVPASDTNIKIVFETKEPIHALRETFLAKGVQLSEVQEFSNYRYLVCMGKDPEGNVIQFIGKN